MTLRIIGLNHHNASLDYREKLAFSHEEIQSCLKDLIANSIEEYEEIIINLGKNAEKLELIKRKIKSEKINNVLFNSVQYTKDLEKLYLELIDKETQKI